MNEQREGSVPKGLVFEQAGPAQISLAQDTYQQIIDHLAATVSYPHWHTENHPSPEQVRSWVEAGELYLARTRPGADGADSSGEVAGVVVLNHEGGDAYEHASWAVEADAGEVLVIHALGVTPEHLRQGVARFLVDSALRVARERGCLAVRLDTYVLNAPALALYRSYGFRDLGLHTLNYEGTDLNEFHLFEYVL